VWKISIYYILMCESLYFYVYLTIFLCLLYNVSISGFYVHYLMFLCLLYNVSISGFYVYYIIFLCLLNNIFMFAL
jgi:hypothetical protein